jgi:hypothetical protein
MPAAPVLAEHCYVCADHGQCPCPECRALGAALRTAVDEAERGETVDLGSFAGYADEVPVAFIQVVGGDLVRVTSQDPAAFRS